MVLKSKRSPKPFAGSLDTCAASKPDCQGAGEDFAHGFAEWKGCMWADPRKIQILEQGHLSDSGKCQPDGRKEKSNCGEKDSRMSAPTPGGNPRFQSIQANQSAGNDQPDEGAERHHHKNETPGVGQQAQLLVPFGNQVFRHDRHGLLYPMDLQVSANPEACMTKHTKLLSGRAPGDSS